MLKPVLKSIDNSEFEAKFSAEQGLYQHYQDVRDSDVTYEEMKPFLSRLPSREIDLIELYYNSGANQKNIARIFGVTQGAVSSRLSRARSRLKFLSILPKISEEDMDENLSCLFDNMELEIIKHMIKTTCQSKTAHLINEKYGLVDEKKRMTQVKIRHRFDKCIALLEEEMAKNIEFKKFYDLLVFIKNNLYMLHEVKLPHFDRGSHAVFSMNI
jgi:predicted transcriptional regulator